MQVGLAGYVYNKSQRKISTFGTLRVEIACVISQGQDFSTLEQLLLVYAFNKQTESHGFIVQGAGGILHERIQVADVISTNFGATKFKKSSLDTFGSMARAKKTKKTFDHWRCFTVQTAEKQFDFLSDSCSGARRALIFFQDALTDHHGNTQPGTMRVGAMLWSMARMRLQTTVCTLGPTAAEPNHAYTPASN